MSEHTKGPLEIAFSTSTKYDERGDVAIVDNERRVVGEAFDLVAKDTHRPALANARLWAAAPDFMDACVSGPDPDQNHVAAVTTLISHFENWYRSDDDVDPSATYELLEEVRALCKGLNAAVAKAQGKQLATEAGR